MIRGHDIAVNRVSTLPGPVRAANAATLRAERDAPAPAGSRTVETGSFAPQADTARFLRYNSFEFRYRPDVGRIILIGQHPETGERVVQIPSERALRVYAQQARTQKALEQVADLEVATPEVTIAPAPTTTPAPTPAPVAATIFAPTTSVDVSV